MTSNLLHFIEVTALVTALWQTWMLFNMDISKGRQIHKLLWKYIPFVLALGNWLIVGFFTIAWINSK